MDLFDDGVLDKDLPFFSRMAVTSVKTITVRVTRPPEMIGSPQAESVIFSDTSSLNAGRPVFMTSSTSGKWTMVCPMMSRCSIASLSNTR